MHRQRVPLANWLESVEASGRRSVAKRVRKSAPMLLGAAVLCQPNPAPAFPLPVGPPHPLMGGLPHPPGGGFPRPPGGFRHPPGGFPRLASAGLPRALARALATAADLADPLAVLAMAA
jgi:hypothetical protein